MKWLFFIRFFFLKGIFLTTIILICGFDLRCENNIVLSTEDNKPALSDSVMYKRILGDIFKKKDYNLLYDIINSNYTENKSTNLYYLKKLYKIEDVVSNTKLIGNVKILEGNIWLHLNDKNSAYKCYNEARVLFDSIGYTKGKAFVFLNLSSIPDRKLTTLGYSKELLLTAARIFEESDDSLNVMKCFNNIAVEYIDRGIRDSIMHFLDLAESFIPYNGPLLLKASILINRGEYYEINRDFEKATELYEEAIRILKQTNAHHALAYVYLQLANISKENNPRRAVDLYENSLTYSELARANKYILMAYEKLGDLYFELKDYKNSAQFLVAAIDLNEEMQSKQLKEKDELLQLHLDLNQKASRISLLNVEKRTLRRNVRDISIIMLILLIMAVTIIVLLRGKIKKKKILLKQEKELSESNRLLLDSRLENEKLQKDLIEEDLKNKSNQVSLFAMQLVKKNEFMQRLQKEVAGLRKRVKKDSLLNEIQRMILEISQNIDSENNMAEFKMQVNKANQEFYSKLDQCYPSLTKTEKQMLGFLKINMSSKEISTILNISTQGVNTKRYRLRQKLELDSETSFEDFFKNLEAI